MHIYRSPRPDIAPSALSVTELVFSNLETRPDEVVQILSRALAAASGISTPAIPDLAAAPHGERPPPSQSEPLPDSRPIFELDELIALLKAEPARAVAEARSCPSANVSVTVPIRLDTTALPPSTTVTKYGRSTVRAPRVSLRRAFTVKVASE